MKEKLESNQIKISYIKFYYSNQIKKYDDQNRKNEAIDERQAREAFT